LLHQVGLTNHFTDFVGEV